MRAVKGSIQFILVLFIGFCVGCATPYQPVGLLGGFSDSQIQNDIFRVNFRGNGYTDLSTASDYALLRAAEIAIQNGFNYFIIIQDNSSIKTSIITTPGYAHTYGDIGAHGDYGSYYAHTTYYPGTSTAVERPFASYLIKCFKRKPNIDAGFIYDANQIEQYIGQKVKTEKTVKKK